MYIYIYIYIYIICPDTNCGWLFRSIFDAIYHIFPCPVCRGHYRSFYHDDILQVEP